MQFLYNLFNHNPVGQRSLEDVIGILGHQMRALGHTAVWEEKNQNFLMRECGFNVVVEGFTDASVEIMARAHAEGARFIILATEEPTPKGFNFGTQKEMIGRQKIFPKAAAYAEGIIHLVPGEHVTQWYSQFCPAAYTELGFAPSLIRIDDRVAPDYEFGFYGSLTPRRKRLLQKLANRTNVPKAVKLMVDFGSQVDRDKDMRRAKVIVQIRKFDAMGLVSSSRCNTALCIGRPVVAEPHLLSHPWDEVVRFSKTEESFLDEAMFARSMWRGLHAGQLAKFKKAFPPEACIGRALAQIGIDLSSPAVPVRITEQAAAAGAAI